MNHGKPMIVMTVVGLGIAAVNMCCGAASPTVKEGTVVLDYAGQLAHCQNVGRETGTYKAYEDCANAIDGGVK